MSYIRGTQLRQVIHKGLHIYDSLIKRDILFETYLNRSRVSKCNYKSNCYYERPSVPLIMQCNLINASRFIWVLKMKRFTRFNWCHNISEALRTMKPVPLHQQACYRLSHIPPTPLKTFDHRIDKPMNFQACVYDQRRWILVSQEMSPFARKPVLRE